MTRLKAKSLKKGVANFIKIISNEIKKIAAQKSEMTLKEISLIIQSIDKLILLQNKLSNIEDLEERQNNRNKLDERDKKIIDNYIEARLRHAKEQISD